MSFNSLKAGVVLSGGKYVIEKTLGQGSFGITYLATAKLKTRGPLGEIDVDAKVAIKEFFIEQINSRSQNNTSIEGSKSDIFVDYKRKFRKEAVNLARLQHPGIIRVFDVFDENNTTYYVMEYIEGSDLDQYVTDNKALSEEEAIDIVSNIGEALQYMHSNKMLHLDVKPKNVMRKNDGSLRLIDFGLSKTFNSNGQPDTTSTIGLGTPGYAPIEQSSYKNDGVFPATLDIYALGATLYKLLTGKRPVDASSIINEGFPMEDLKARGVSANTINVLLKAMAPRRNDRFKSVREMLDALNGITYLADQSTTTFNGNGATFIPFESASTQTQLPQSEPAGHKFITESNSNRNNHRKSNNKNTLFIAAVIILGLIMVGMIFVVVNSDNKNDDQVQTAEVIHPAASESDDISVSETSIPESMSSAEPELTSSFVNGHEAVDLGLSVRWATNNVGANSPSDFGQYFAWGETSPKHDYSESTSQTYGMNMGDIGGSSNDVAHTMWGGSWRLPTKSEMKELENNCSWVWTYQGSRAGYKVTGPNGNSIFLPAAGFKAGTSGKSVGSYGNYWSSTPNADGVTAYSIYFYAGAKGKSWDGKRRSGLTVRPVTY